MKRANLATHNDGKIQEFRHLFNEINVKILMLAYLTGCLLKRLEDHFGNSLIKAKEGADWYG